MHRLLYRSRSSLAGWDMTVEAEVEKILESSAANNLRDGVTGALMFTASIFIQALEGPRETLEHTFERICNDLRHSEIQVIEFAPICERAFGEWSLHRVHAGETIEALLAQVAKSPAPAYSAQAAAQAASLMSTLIRLEEGSVPPWRCSGDASLDGRADDRRVV
ncbi:MAG: BLUF domain-containing protein [Caulobacteraceae bacterium]|nr:BLUF domain-containing protein [Caulobacter sp.]